MNCLLKFKFKHHLLNHSDVPYKYFKSFSILVSYLIFLIHCLFYMESNVQRYF